MSILEKHVLRKKNSFKIESLTKFLDDPTWLCVEKLKKHIFETQNPEIITKQY